MSSLACYLTDDHTHCDALDALLVGSSGRWSPTALAITHLMTLGT